MIKSWISRNSVYSVAAIILFREAILYFGLIEQGHLLDLCLMFVLSICLAILVRDSLNN